MRKRAGVVLLSLSIIFVLLSLIGDNSLDRLRTLREQYSRQTAQNREIKGYVDSLSEEVYRLQSDPRTLEKAARNELGMARPNEVIFFFEKRSEPDKE